MGESIRVIVRFRPINSREKKENAKVVVKVIQNCLVQIDHPDKVKHTRLLEFPFDTVWDWTATQTEVYDRAASHLVEQIFDGFNATIFAYGQTGAGKTYSMEGKLGSASRGIIPRTVESIFAMIEEADESMEYLLQVSYVEIYLEALRDLFNPGNNSMKIKDGKAGIYIDGVTEMYVRDSQEVMDLMTVGAGNRTVSSTQMNAVSSRSHGVFMLKLTQQNVATGSKKIAKLKMVDLAGAEKVSKTGASGLLLEQAKKINQSLSALGNVMNALSTGKPFIPYRDSVLTRLLSDSLGGNCKTTLLVAVSPSDFNVDETITTLRFGTRAKKIKNKAKVNAEKTVAEYKVEVADLHARLKGCQMLLKALRKDLETARKGDLKEDDRCKSDTIVHAFDMKDLMTPPDKLGKKKKGKDKKKAFDLSGFKEEKKKKKKKKGHKGDDNKDESKDDNKDDDNHDDHDNDSGDSEVHSTTGGSVTVSNASMQESKLKLENAEKRAEEAEKKIQDLQQQLILARALVGKGATEIVQQAQRNSIMAKNIINIDDHKVNDKNVSVMKKDNHSKRKSILPPPTQLKHKISDTTPQSGTELVAQLSHRTSITPRVQQTFEFAKGTMQYQANTMKIKTETIIEKEEINDYSELKPELIEQARRGLLVENYTLRQKAEQQMDELNKKDKLLVKKIEQLRKQKEKLEDNEMECDKLLMEKELLTERLDAFQKERQRELQNTKNAGMETLRLKKRCSDLERKLEANNKQTQKTIQEIREVESQRANEFIKQAKKEINKRLKKEYSKYEGTTQNDLAIQRRQMDLEMEFLKQQTFDRLQQIEFEHMKMQQTLQTKIEEYIKLKMKLSEKNDYIEQLTKQIERKDKILKRQTGELQAFGGLKLQSDQIHQEQYQEAQKTIFDLQKQIKKLQRLNASGGGKVKGNWEQFGYAAPKSNDINSVIELQKKQNMPIPLRGKKTNDKGKGHKPKVSNTADFFKSMNGANNINKNNYKSKNGYLGTKNKSSFRSNGSVFSSSSYHSYNNSAYGGGNSTYGGSTYGGSAYGGSAYGNTVYTNRNSSTYGGSSHGNSSYSNGNNNTYDRPKSMNGNSLYTKGLGAGGATGYKGNHKLNNRRKKKSMMNGGGW